MKSYKVLAKLFGEWQVTDHHINRMYAESICKYYMDRGVEAVIEEE